MMGVLTCMLADSCGLEMQLYTEEVESELWALLPPTGALRNLALNLSNTEVAPCVDFQITGMCKALCSCLCLPCKALAAHWRRQTPGARALQHQGGPCTYSSLNHEIHRQNALHLALPCEALNDSSCGARVWENYRGVVLSMLAFGVRQLACSLPFTTSAAGSWALLAASGGWHCRHCA